MLTFFKINFFKKIFEEHTIRVSGSRSGQMFCRSWSRSKLFVKVIVTASKEISTKCCLMIPLHPDQAWSKLFHSRFFFQVWYWKKISRGQKKAYQNMGVCFYCNQWLKVRLSAIQEVMSGEIIMSQKGFTDLLILILLCRLQLHHLWTRLTKFCA